MELKIRLKEVYILGYKKKFLSSCYDLAVSKKHSEM